MLESKLQTFIIKFLVKHHDADVYKTVAVGRKGYPDLTAYLPGGQSLLIEVKTPTGKLRPSQVRCHERLRARGTEVLVVTSVKEVSQYLSKYSCK